VQVETGHAVKVLALEGNMMQDTLQRQVGNMTQDAVWMEAETGRAAEVLALVGSTPLRLSAGKSFEATSVALPLFGNTWHDQGCRDCHDQGTCQVAAKVFSEDSQYCDTADAGQETRIDVDAAALRALGT